MGLGMQKAYSSDNVEFRREQEARFFGSCNEARADSSFYRVREAAVGRQTNMF